MKLTAIVIVLHALLTYLVAGIATVHAETGDVETAKTVTASPTAKAAPAFRRDDRASEHSWPRYKQFVDETRELLRDEAKANSISDKVELTIGMVNMSKRLKADPRYATSPTLQQTRRHLHARLRTIKKKTAIAERRKKKRPQKIEIKPEVLGQLNQALNGGRANRNNRPNNNLFPADYGPMLVELIQQTISPSSWDVNGGASTIQYWRPGMALVVRAPQSLHEETAPVLRQLRRQ